MQPTRPGGRPRTGTFPGLVGGSSVPIMADYAGRADLVLEGGGVKGIALVGAISVLMDAGYTFGDCRVAGTSAGSIVGAMVAAGCTGPEMVDLVGGLDYAAFMDGQWWDRFAVGKALDIFIEQGIYDGRYAQEWVAAQLAAKGVTTFADLPYADPDGRDLPEHRRYRLVVNVSDVSFGRLRQLPWDYGTHYGLRAADIPVAEAVRASMSIPFFYRPVKLRHGDGETSVLVDGGMLSNFPVGLFDAPPGVAPRWPTFGIKLSSRPPKGGVTGRRVSGAVGLTAALISTMSGFYDRMHVDDQDVCARTIFVDTAGISATDFDLTTAQRDLLFSNGQEAARAFLATWDFAEYIRTYRTAPQPTVIDVTGPAQVDLTIPAPADPPAPARVVLTQPTPPPA